MFGEGIVVKKGNPKNVRSVDDLAKDPTIRIGIALKGWRSIVAETEGFEPSIPVYTGITV